MTTNLLRAAAALALVCGLLELYEAFSFIEDIKRGSTNPVRGVGILVVPFLIIAGGIGIYFDRLIVGAGTVLAALSIQHVMIDISPRHWLPVVLGAAAVVLAMYVQKQRDYEDMKNVETERVTTLAA
jgi:hypothetical protein